MKTKMSDVERSLWEMQFRLKALHSLGANRAASEELARFIEDTVQPKKEDSTVMTREEVLALRKETCERIVDSFTDADIRRELCGIRIQTETNYARANSIFAESFFEVITLADDERPVIQNETKQEIDVGYVSQDGRPKCVKTIAQQDEVLIPLRPLSTDRVGYFVTDLYNGNLRPAAQRTIDIGYDLQNKYDLNAYNLLKAARASGGAYGAFDFASTTKRNLRDLAIHSRVITSNLPTTNDIVLAGNTAASGKFRLAVLEAVMQYCTSWGNIFTDGPLMPTGLVIVPSGEAATLTTEIRPTGNTNNPIANELMQKFLNFTWMGINWMLIPDSTIPPGKCYPVLNKPVGYIYRKPSQDREGTKYDDEKDYEERWGKMITGYAIPSNKRLHALRIDYGTAS